MKNSQKRFTQRKLSVLEKRFRSSNIALYSGYYVQIFFEACIWDPVTWWRSSAATGRVSLGPWHGFSSRYQFDRRNMEQNQFWTCLRRYHSVAFYSSFSYSTFFCRFFRVFFRVEFVNFESLRGMQLLLAKPTFFCENMMFSEEPDSILLWMFPFLNVKACLIVFLNMKKRRFF